MAQTIKQVDDYIAKAAPFAKPILIHLRKLIHQACPDIEEKFKWSFPCFDYKGIVCNIAAFKNHCAFGFWKAAIMNDPYKILTKENRNAMGHFDQLKSLKDLPADELLIEYIKQAVKLNEDGIKLPPRVKATEKAKKELATPDYFVAALNKNKKVLKVFEAFPYSHKKEYIQWITAAKTEATRTKRITTAIEWIAAGKGRNWKYETKTK